jgi:hypothetical protein
VTKPVSHTDFAEASIVDPITFFVVYRTGSKSAFAQWSHIHI